MTTTQTAQQTWSGLTEQEVLARRQGGQGNNVRLETSRSYADIIRHNVLNLINIILFVIGGVMIGIGRVGDAVTSVGLIVLNILIGVYQEIRAKRQLDKIALLTRPKITVIRASHERTVDASELVVGDIVQLRPGDQIVVDGVVVGAGKADVDESLLTGESDAISKSNGDEILSGSFCVAGSVLYEATRVGNECFANKLTQNARKFSIAYTPLQREINFLLRILLLLALFIGSTMAVGSIIAGLPFLRQVQMAAVVAGLVPNGLFFMVILAYAMGALRIVQRGALVQQSNAVESLSNVTVLCTDKTGTLTANKINYHEIYPVGIDKAQLEHLIGSFASSASATNKTSEAIIAGIAGDKLSPVDEVPFSSALKWSALAFDSELMRGVYVLGALAMLRSQLQLDPAAQVQIEAWSDAGLRVLVFARNPEVLTLHNSAGEPELPSLTLLGAISFSDELRPYLRETIAGFRQNGIKLKIISGDDPQTVAALAKQAGFDGDLKYVSGTDLVGMDDAQFAQVADETTVFGRITPDQKERLVGALQQKKHYVAMIGDGVNDVLSLKKANLGIAMESGSAATRGVADMILINDSFSALPAAFDEGQRIINGMKDILRLFLTRVTYAALLIVAIELIGLGFPFIPKQNSLLVALGVGLPTLCLAIWARPGPVPKHGFLREIARFVVPAAISVSVFGTLVYVLGFFIAFMDVSIIPVTPETMASFEEYVGIDYTLTSANAYQIEVAHLVAQTALTTFTVFASLILIVFVEPPIEYFVGGDEFSGDWRPTLLAGGLLLGFISVIAIEPLRAFFEMIDLPVLAYVAIALITLIWMLLLRMTWRRNWLERFLQIEPALT